MTHVILGLSAFDLSLHEVVTNIPHDPAAFVVYLLLGTFVGMIWHGSRRSTVERHQRVTGAGDIDQYPSRQPGQQSG